MVNFGAPNRHESPISLIVQDNPAITSWVQSQHASKNSSRVISFLFQFLCSFSLATHFGLSVAMEAVIGSSTPTGIFSPINEPYEITHL